MAVLRIIGFALAGFVAGYVITASLGVLLLLPADGGGDAGGTAMGIFFALGPLGGVIGAVAGVVVSLRRRRKPD